MRPKYLPQQRQIKPPVFELKQLIKLYMACIGHEYIPSFSLRLGENFIKIFAQQQAT
jgi:hypothetical protein